MMRRAFLAFGFVACAAAPVAAQVLGLPVINNGAPTGISIGADVGFSNDDAGKGTAIGAHAGIGLGFFGVAAMVSRFAPNGGGDAIVAPGASATLRLLGGPLVPFRLTMQAGASRWTAGTMQTTHVPLSIGLAATIPNPAFAIKPWIAPRYEVYHTDVNGTTTTNWNFAISGGVDLSLLNGLSIRAAYDRASINDTHPGIFSLGLGFAP